MHSCSAVRAKLWTSQTWNRAGMRVTSSATPSGEDTLRTRCPWWTPVGTPRRRDDYRMTRASTSAVTKVGFRRSRCDLRQVGQNEGRITLLHSKFDEILVPAKRRSAGKLTKGECAGGALSNPLPLIHPRLSSLPAQNAVSHRPTRLTSDRGNGSAPSDCHFPACIRTACFFSVRALFLARLLVIIFYD